MLNLNQRELLKDKISISEFVLLQYFLSKEETEFLSSPSDILENLPILQIEKYHLKRLLKKLTQVGYITTQTFYGKDLMKIALTKKLLDIANMKNDKNVKFDINVKIEQPKMTKMSDLELKNDKNVKIPLINEDIKSNSTNIVEEDIITTNIINNNKLNNKVRSNNTDAPYEEMMKLFELYPKYQTKNYSLLPVGFNAEKLDQAIKESSFLQHEVYSFNFFCENYTKVISGGFRDRKSSISAFSNREYSEKEINSLFDNLDDIKF